MTFQMKPIVGAVALATATATAAETPNDKGGKLTAQVKLQHVVDAKDNGYDPNTGTAEMFTLKYLSSSINGAKIGMGFYAVGDLFDNTDLDIDPGRPASGLYVTGDASVKAVLGELFVDYSRNDLNVYGGRMMFKSPLTTSIESTLPDFHTVVGANYKATKSFSVGLAQMTQMSIAARGASEFGLIGEGTGTAGIIQSPVALARAEFHDISTVALGEGAEDTNGLTILNASFKPSKKMNVSG
ncbi:MAG: hypothetical protein U9R28_01375 [Pseudomonadota bacterium]|nr:hypothetical protein [Pseudomonadota bacterium]